MSASERRTSHLAVWGAVLGTASPVLLLVSWAAVFASGTVEVSTTAGSATFLGYALLATVLMVLGAAMAIMAILFAARLRVRGALAIIALCAGLLGAGLTILTLTMLFV